MTVDMKILSAGRPRSRFRRVPGMLAALVLACVTVALAASRTAAAQSTLSENEQRLVANLERDVNQRFWLLFPGQKTVVTCPSPIDRLDRCTAAHQGSFVVESISLGRAYPTREKPKVYLSKFYFVQFDDGAKGYIPVAQRHYFLSEDPEITAGQVAKDREEIRATCKQLGEPRLDMTKEQAVATCWGNPRRVMRAVSSRREFLIYDAGRFLTFENGRLIAIR
jgi:hypothetical protein